MAVDNLNNQLGPRSSLQVTIWTWLIHLRNLLTHTLLFWHFLTNLNFEFKNILEYIRTMLSGNT